MDEVSANRGSTHQSIQADADADRTQNLGCPFRLNNLIGLDCLNRDVVPSFFLFGVYDLLILDPGRMVGWAGITNNLIECGQAEWHHALKWDCDAVFIESTPFAARRTFDTWPMWYTGAVIAKMHPQEVKFVQPTDLKAASKWFSLPRGHSLGVHAKDALTHLVGVLVKQSQKSKSSSP